MSGWGLNGWRSIHNLCFKAGGRCRRRFGQCERACVGARCRQGQTQAFCWGCGLHGSGRRFDISLFAGLFTFNTVATFATTIAVAARAATAFTVFTFCLWAVTFSLGAVG